MSLWERANDCAAVCPFAVAVPYCLAETASAFPRQIQIYLQQIFLVGFYRLFPFLDLDLPAKNFMPYWLVEKRYFRIRSLLSFSEVLYILTCRGKIIDFFLWPFT